MKIIKTSVNEGYYGPPRVIVNNQADLKGVYNSINKLYLDVNSTDNKGYSNISYVSFRKKNHTKTDKKLIYEIEKRIVGDEGKCEFWIKTGLFVGYISINNKYCIWIDSGYGSHFLSRMLDVANNVFFDAKNDMNVKAIKNTKINPMSLILEHLFLTSFRKSYSMGLPLHYQKIKERGFNVKGRISIKDYLSRDMIIGSELTYEYSRLSYVQDMIDVLYLALKVINDRHSLSGDISKYYSQLKQMYSGKKLTMNTIRRLERHKSLNNPMYSSFKKTIEFARYVLEDKSIIRNDEENKKGVSGFLIDISELWEVYLANLLGNRHIIDKADGSEFDVESQTELKLYPKTFFSRPNYPDIVLSSPKSIVVLDAKFKKMRFINKDVDRNDLFQINSYAGYYRALQEHKLDSEMQVIKLCSLVYPHAPKDDVLNSQENDLETEQDLEHSKLLDRNNISCGLYGLKYGDLTGEVSTLFSIEYLEVGNSMEELIANEEHFLNRVEAHIEGLEYKCSIDA